MTAKPVEKYVQSVPEMQKEAFIKLRRTIADALPEGFAETMQYGMIGYVVPHSIFPAGYHCDPKQPLPFIHIASRKNYIAFYHMGLYANPELLEWFRREYAKASTAKLDMGKSCVRFKKPDQIPFTLISKLCGKIAPQDWIRRCESVPGDKPSRRK